MRVVGNYALYSRYLGVLDGGKGLPQSGRRLRLQIRKASCGVVDCRALRIGQGKTIT